MLRQWYLGTPSQSVLEDWSSADHLSPQEIMSTYLTGFVTHHLP